MCKDLSSRIVFSVIARLVIGRIGEKCGGVFEVGKDFIYVGGWGGGGCIGKGKGKTYFFIAFSCFVSVFL